MKPLTTTESEIGRRYRAQRIQELRRCIEHFKAQIAAGKDSPAVRRKLERTRKTLRYWARMSSEHAARWGRIVTDPQHTGTRLPDC